ncbi:MAG: hypothetical protein IT160_04200 [Bryobacterales bacterium]|nr:hypothetical protein [Bryobacterales bacterium]
MRYVQISNLALEGMNRAAGMLNNAAAKIARAPLDIQAPETDTLDLSQEMVALLVARQSFKANVKAAEAGDQMTRTLLDELG